MKYIKLKLHIVLLLSLCFFISCADNQEENILNIHIIPHSHMDAGWLNTANNYFNGYSTENCVKCTFDTLLVALSENTVRTFTVSDIFFFHKWYNQIGDKEKLLVRELVKSERLNFVNGGWTMHDEATTFYKHQIENIRIGIEFLLKEFDIRPKIGWQLDPFGHSSANVRLIQ